MSEPSATTSNIDAQARLKCCLETEFAEELFSLPSNAWEFGLCFGVHAESLLKVMKWLRDEEQFLFNMLIDVTAVDWLDKREPRFDVVYQLHSLTYGHRLCLKVQVDEENAEIDSVRELWPAANFLEREVWDMFGVRFRGHGDLRRILMYEEFVGHPLRKDYPKQKKQPRVQMRVPEQRNTSLDLKREELASSKGSCSRER